MSIDHAESPAGTPPDRHPNRSAITLILVANAVSGVAQGISMIAIPWYFAQRELMSGFGLAYILAAALAFFWSPYSGILIDKYNRKHILLIVDLIGALLLLGIGSYGLWRGALPSLAVGGVFVITFLIYNIHYPNLYAFVQEITPSSRYGRITSLIETIHQTTTVVAGAVAALLLAGTQDGAVNIFGFRLDLGWEVAPWSISEIFLLDGSTYLLALGLVALIRFVPLVERPAEVGTLGQRLRTGFQYLRDHPRIFWFGMASYAIFTSVLVVNFYQAPTYVAQHLRADADVFASGEMWFALGAIGAALTVRYLFRALSLTASVIVLTLLAAGFYFVLSFSRSLVLYYLFFLILGIANSGSRIQRVNWLFATVPNQVYGRTGSILFILNTAIRIAFVGLFALPFFQQAEYVAYTFGLLGLYLLAAAGVLLFKYRTLRM